MNDKAVQRYVDQFAPLFADDQTPEQRADALRWVIKEIERDTRHRCYQIVGQAQEQVFNLDWDQPPV